MLHKRLIFLSLTLSCLVAGVGRAGDPPQSLGSELVVSGLDRPVFLTAPAGDERLFVLEQPGRILIVENGALLPTPFLDIDSLVSNLRSYSERGLLGLAFHPDYPSEPCFFVNYTQTGNHDTAIARYLVSEDANIADVSSADVLRVIAQPFANHNGGHVAFGPEPTPTLYVGMGDGGSADDPGNRAQTLQLPLGKMLRFEASCSGPLAIPADNPFVGEADPKDDVLDEIWSFGLRNPYRFSFDRATGDLYIADVGQNEIEEIDFEAAGSAGGLNFGWRIEEGSSCFDEELAAVPCGDASLVRPIHEYPHTDGISVTGGYVYRGTISELRGHYFFADWGSKKIWSFRYDEMSGVQDFTDRTSSLEPSGGVALGNPTSFGEDGFGELYIVTQGGTGAVFRVVPEPRALHAATAVLLVLAALRGAGRGRASSAG